MIGSVCGDVNVGKQRYEARLLDDQGEVCRRSQVRAVADVGAEGDGGHEDQRRTLSVEKDPHGIFGDGGEGEVGDWTGMAW